MYLLGEMKIPVEHVPEKCRNISDLHFDIFIKNTGYLQH